MRPHETNLMNLQAIETVIVVMQENRSFDHLLGYLSLPPHNRQDVEGLAPGLMNSYNGVNYPIFRLPAPGVKAPYDPPHERDDIAIQMTGLPGALNTPPPYPMIGFVSSSAGRPNRYDPNVHPSPLVMGYYTAEDLPATHFFAEHFCICDHWFTPIPTGTQPNRLMAMSGYSRIDVNQSFLLPRQKLVYDWLNERGIRWRVYHQGIPFFLMMEGWHLKVLTDSHFRNIDDFEEDLQTESDETYPQVIFIEPRYSDAPHGESQLPADDHPPTPITNGQHFLLKIYSSLTTNQDRWQKSAMIVTYDEHGGFFDHVSPIAIETNPPPDAIRQYPTFVSTGPRVPGYIISPFVQKRSVYKGNLDHTSILKLIAKRFGRNAEGYSHEVSGRPVGDLSDAFTLDAPREDLPTPEGLGHTPSAELVEDIPKAFKEAVDAVKRQNPTATMEKFPELFTYF
jgi:phospholipase C